MAMRLETRVPRNARAVRLISSGNGSPPPNRAPPTGVPPAAPWAAGGAAATRAESSTDIGGGSWDGVGGAGAKGLGRRPAGAA